MRHLICVWGQVHSSGIKHCSKEDLVDDSLHTMDLGVTQRYNALALTKIIERDAYDTGLTIKDDVKDETCGCFES